MANIREIILGILMEYDRDGSKKPSLLKDSLEKYDYLETRDKAFIKRCVDGCLERQIQIDYIINQTSNTKTDKMQPMIRNLIRMGTYQIMFMDSVPDSAACNEAVKLAVKHKFTGLKGFVNGVLRNISRNKENVVYPEKRIDNGCEYLSVYYSMPKWLCKMWVSEYGFDKTENMLEFFLKPRPTTIRLSKEDPSFEKELVNVGVIVKKSDILPYALELEKTDNIRFLPGYEDGKFTVQDVSSMLVAEIADIKEGNTVIDVCAAPGGKTLHASVKTGEEGRIISRDISERKCEIILENVERLGLKNVEVSAGDARLHDISLEDMADVLYLDVPCSGLGIIGRKSDIKLNISKNGIEELTKLQWEIVKASFDYVKENGILIYSTCTVNRTENQNMVKRICEEFGFERENFEKLLPDVLKKKADGQESELCKTARNGYIQLLPGEYGTDGFFISKLRRIKR